MKKRNIIVIGASTGGFSAITQLIADLPSDLDTAIFIVWHMSPEVQGILPQVLNRQKTIMATNAVDNEPVVFNRIYVAPPDRHMILENGFIRVTRGPKENRFRPAVDPLFRSAAQIYGARVIGIVLTGALDDGTAGLWTIKNRGGITIVQDPADAEVPSMPEHAIEAVEIDYKLPVKQMAALLEKLTAETVSQTNNADIEENEKTELEIMIASQKSTSEKGMLQIGQLTPYACPECHGVLSAIKDGGIIRYRCHTGHAYSADILLTSITGNIEDTLWNAVRGVEESITLLNSMGDHYAGNNQLKLAAMYFKKANEAHGRVKLMRQALVDHEQLTTKSISHEVSAVNGDN